MSEHTTTASDICRKEGCRDQNHGEVDDVWDARPVEGASKAAYEAAASRLGGIDAAHSHTATACSERHPCYGCCIQARAALEAAAAVDAVTEQERLAFIDGLRRLRREHHISQDCWYSCPKSGECCWLEDGDPIECDCGADPHNALLDELLEALTDRVSRLRHLSSRDRNQEDHDRG